MQFAQQDSSSDSEEDAIQQQAMAAQAKFGSMQANKTAGTKDNKKNKFDSADYFSQ